MRSAPRAAWAASLCAVLGWLHFCLGVGTTDLVVTVVAHVCVLPMLAARFDRRLLPSFGCALCGVCVGFNLVDLCFDRLIVLNRAVPDGTGHGGHGSLTPRHVAWFYYTTMLNSSHINLTLLVYVLVSSIGSMMGLMDGCATVRNYWLAMCSVAAVGNTFCAPPIAPCAHMLAAVGLAMCARARALTARHPPSALPRVSRRRLVRRAALRDDQGVDDLLADRL